MKKGKNLNVKSIRKEEGYFNKLNEWQEHQYDPGYYTGGNIPPIITNPRKYSVIGWLFIITSIFFCIMSVFVVIQGFDKEQILSIVVFIFIVFVFYSIQFIVGIRFIHKGRIKSKGNAKVNVKIIVSLIITFSLLLSATIVYRFNNHQEEISIISIKDFILRQQENSNYIYVKSIDKTLSCSIDEYFTLWSLKISNDSEKNKHVSIKLEYIWNNFRPHIGKVTKVIK